MDKKPILNKPTKREYPPMHTAEHLLNATMGKLFGCERSRNTHIERKKSKCDYEFSSEPSKEDMERVEQEVNKAIQRALTVTTSYMSREEAKGLVDLSKLPADASDTLRIVKVGDYDICACIGEHVENTSEIGEFYITTYTYNDGNLRIRFKLK